MTQLLLDNFLGKAPRWYKLTIIAFLVINPIVFYLISPFIAGWLLLIEFIFTLAFALQCYPVPSGGLLAIEAVAINMTSAQGVYDEVAANLPTLLLLIFMVAGIYYLKDVLLFFFTRVFVSVKNKTVLSVLFAVMAGILSAFLDALTLMAIIIAVCFNFYAIYHRVAGNAAVTGDPTKAAKDMEEFKGFLRNLVMHGAVGTTLGGTMTIVGEPQNLMIGTKMGWSFTEFFMHVSVISVPVAISGILLCPLLEIFKVCGFGYQLPDSARVAILNDARTRTLQITKESIFKYSTQIVVGMLLVAALALHVAEIGLIGLCLIIVLSAFSGLIKEHDFAESFNNAMPFVTLIIIFFAILAVVHDQHLVTPLIQWVFQFDGKIQLLALYFVNGTLSFVSDSVFIASVFISEIDKAFVAGAFSREWYEQLGTVVNMGTNIPALATPNGQAAFLFLLTSSLAPLLRLSYMEMVKLALPYTIVTSGVGAVAIYYLM